MCGKVPSGILVGIWKFAVANFIEKDGDVCQQLRNSFEKRQS